MNKEQWEQEVLRFEAEYEDDSPLTENWNGYFTDVISRNREFPIDLRPSPGKRMREVTHGGIISSMFDSAIGLTAIFAAGWREATTIDLNVSFLRPL